MFNNVNRLLNNMSYGVIEYPGNYGELAHAPLEKWIKCNIACRHPRTIDIKEIPKIPSRFTASMVRIKGGTLMFENPDGVLLLSANKFSLKTFSIVRCQSGDEFSCQFVTFSPTITLVSSCSIQ